MTKPKSPGLGPGSFTIVQPSLDQTVTLGAGNTVHVEVDSDGTFTGFCAAVYDDCGPTPSFNQCQPLTSAGGNTFTGDVPVNFLDAFDIPDVDKQIVVYGTSDSGTSRVIQQFRVVHGGSGPALGVGIPSASGSQGRCGFCSGNNPIPVSLQLTLDGDGGIVNEDCDNCATLNDGAVLQHSGDACFSCCWYSDAIDFCEDDEEPGYWKLQKSGVATWDLWLLQPQDDDNPAVIIHYTVTTLTDNDCSFPITLGLDVSSVGTECSGWPDAITISQGP